MLVFQFVFFDRAGYFQKPVGQSRLAMINMADDHEIPDF
jgi:hypothetical protein